MRRFLQDLTLLAAVSAAGGYALARVDPPTTQAPALALEPIVLDRATPAAPDEAMNLLRTATIFSSAADRKSTRLNSSHLVISYAVFCLTRKMSVNVFIFV